MSYDNKTINYRKPFSVGSILKNIHFLLGKISLSIQNHYFNIDLHLYCKYTLLFHWNILFLLLLPLLGVLFPLLDMLFGMIRSAILIDKLEISLDFMDDKLFDEESIIWLLGDN